MIIRAAALLLLCAAPAVAQEAPPPPPSVMIACLPDDRPCAIAREAVALAAIGKPWLAYVHLSQLDRVAKTILVEGRPLPAGPK